MPIDLNALTEPVSDEEVCGPDLEMTGDADYMRFSARIEGILPKSFADFDRGSIEFEKEFATIDKLLGEMRDLRLLVFRAKLAILNRDLPNFVAALMAAESLLDQRWEAVHPQLLDGDPLLRVISLQTLDDMPDTVMPLQQTQLFKTRRFGPVSYRTYLLSEDKITPRKATDDGGEDERKPTASDLRGAIAEAELEELIQARDLSAKMFAALQHIEALVDERSGQPLTLRFESVRPLAEGIARFLDQAVAQRDPTLALAKTQQVEVAEEQEGGGASTSPRPAGAVDSHPAALRALKVAAAYFGAMEPSSLVRPMIKQAEALVGKSFYDAIYTLVPDYAGQATIRIARDLPLTLTIERLSSLPGMDEDPSRSWIEQNEADELSPPEEEYQAAPEPDPIVDEGSEQSTEGEEGQESVEGEAPSAPSPPPPPSPQKKPPRAVFEATNRYEALALIDQVAGYFRIAEPSSPIPALLDHARSLGGRDFFGLLRDVLPKSALRVDE